MSEVLLLGDSHLARIRGERTRHVERETNRRVVNAAVGGANSLDLARQLNGHRPADTVVVSVGTNDAAPWKEVPLARFGMELTRLLADLPESRLIYLTSPGVDDRRLTGPGDRTNAVVQRYSAAAAKIFAEHGGTTLDVRSTLSGVSFEVYESDGVHLTHRAYERLLTELVQRIGPAPHAGVTGPGPCASP
ncbi:SGNH/GDSL hydrolase family protein [Actinopolymorpha pittospori]